MTKSLLNILITAALMMVTEFAMANASTTLLSWHTCGDLDKGECTTIKVPIDWAKPGGETFNLAIGRLPATDPEHRIGVLFVNPGGPGLSGIDDYITGRGISDTSILRKRFDIISWDPRGVGRSHPIQCSQDLLAKAPVDMPDTEKEFKQLIAYNAELGADCRANTGPLFDYVDTMSTVRDMEAIRVVLGEETLSYYGDSYGTQIGQQYAELFPDHLRAMAIDSNMDHSITSFYQYLETATQDMEGSFNEFADWCARTTDCALYGRDVRVLWDDLYDRAEKGKLLDPSTGKQITPHALRSQAFRSMYAPNEMWAMFATWLAGLENGTHPLIKFQHTELDTNAYQAIWCQDWAWGVDRFDQLKSYREKLARVAPHTRMSEFWSDGTMCFGWPSKVTNPQHRLSIKTTIPILITASRYDVATPNAWNVAVAEQIPTAILLRYDGVGHVDYSSSSCARDAIEMYLTTLNVPRSDFHCAAEWPDGKMAKRFLPLPFGSARH